MTPEEFIKLESSINQQIASTIKLTVNGKIDRMNEKLDRYIESDNEWKRSAQPSIDLGKNVRGFGVVMVGIIGIGAGLVAILDFVVRLLSKK